MGQLLHYCHKHHHNQIEIDTGCYQYRYFLFDQKKLLILNHLLYRYQQGSFHLKYSMQHQESRSYQIYIH